ncbi:MAG: O-antigen polymerase [Balneolaceae bacterium]
MVKKIYTYFPLFLFSGVWCLVVIFSSLNWYNIHSVATDTWILLGSGLYAFISGYLIFTFFDSDFADLTLKRKKVQLDEVLIAKTIVVMCLFSFFGTYLVMDALGNIAGNGISTYFSKPIDIRRAYVEIQSNPLVPAPLSYKLGSYLINFCFVANLLGGALLTSTRKIKWIGLLPLFSAFLTSISIFGRFGIISSLAFLFLSYLIISFFKPDSERVRLIKNLSVTAVLVVFGLYFLFYYIVLARYSIALDLQEYFNKTIYFYFSGGVSALDDFLKTNFTHSYGTSSFRSFFKWLARFGLWPSENINSSYDSFTKVSPSLSINTYTYIRSLYIDFGITGVVFFSFAWGAGVKILLKKVYSNFNILYLYFAIILIYSSLMTFYSFYFESISLVIFWMIPLILFHGHFKKCFKTV